MDKKLKRILADRSARLVLSDKSLRDIFDIMFSDDGLILCEGNDGFRTYRHSYGDVKRRIQSAAAALHARIGDTHGYVALAIDNSTEWIVGFWAILMSGNKPYLVNLRYPKSLTDPILKTLDIRYTVTSGESGLDTEDIDIASLTSDKALTDVAFENELAFSSSATSMNEVVCFYTGREIAAQILNFKTIVKNNPTIAAHHKGALKQLAFLPFYHIFGLFAVYFWFTFFGTTLVFLRDLSADTILKTCRRHEVTHIFAVPALWHTVEKSVNAEIDKKGEKTRRKFDTALGLCKKLPCLAPLLMKDVTAKLFGRSVKFCINGGSYIRKSALELINGIGYPLYNGYGMSEIGITSVELRRSFGERVQGSVGQPFDAVEYRLTDDGILQVRGSSLCVKKLVNGKETELSDWFDTGDRMYVRDGHYFITGRQSDVVIGENGENIDPDTVEGAFSLPAAKALSVLGLGDKESEQLSLIVQINSFATEETIRKTADAAYAVNATLDTSTAVRRFYFTTDELVTGDSIKVSRTQLKKRIAAGEIKLTPFSDMKPRAAGDTSPLMAEVTDVIARVLNIDAGDITPDSHIFFDLGATSIQYFSVLTELSAHFELAAYDKTEKYCYTPREICNFLERYL